MISVNVFKAAYHFNPAKVTDLQPDATVVDELKSFYFLEQAVPGLKKELLTYLAAAEGVSEGVELLEWWKKHEEKLPYWAAACQQVLSCKPSSASVESI